MLAFIPHPRRTLLAAVLALAGIAGVIALPQPNHAGATTTTTTTTARPVATAYNIDPVHSAVVFSAIYMGMSPFYGQFTEYSGTLEYDGENADSLKVMVEIPMDSVDTHNAQRDTHLESPDFFNAREYPTIKFESTELTGSEGDWTLKGKLTMHGVTKDVEAKVTHLKAVETPRGNRMGLGAEFTVKRSDYNVTTMMGDAGISDEITLRIGLQGVMQ